MGLFLASWVVSAVLFWLHLRHSRALAAGRTNGFVAANPRATRPPNPADSSPAAPLGQSVPSLTTAGPAEPAPLSADLVDINTADEAALLRLDGMTPALAANLVAVRSANGPYADEDDLIARCGPQPHQWARLRRRIAFGPIQRPEGPPRQGRILDI